MPSALIIAEYGSLNGGERSLLAVLPYLQQQGFSFSAILPCPSPLSDAFQALGVTIFAFDFLKGPTRKPLELLRLELADLFGKLRPDLIHCNSLSASRICGPVCRDLEIPSLGYLRDIIKLNRTVIGDLNAADRLIAVSHATREFHIDQGLDHHRVSVVHNGVDKQAFQPNPSRAGLRRSLNLPDDTPLVLFVGQIGLRKGLDVWLAAAEQVLKQVPNACFLIVGNRHSKKQESIDYENQLLERSKTGKLNGHVYWLGNRPDVADIMPQCNVLLHCARQEPLGRVLLEALASGLPIVATDVGGTTEILCEKGYAPYLIPKDNPLEASQAVARILGSAELQKNLGKIGRQIAQSKFSVSACGQALSGYYLALIDSL